MFTHLSLVVLFCSCFASAATLPKRGKGPDVIPKDEFFSYVTRSDIFVPRWDVTINHRELFSEGYWFTAPYEDLVAEASTKRFIGPAIYDQNGELVWSPGRRFHNDDVYDFRVSYFNGKPLLTWISPYHQAIMILDEHYGEVKRHPIGKSEQHSNMHEFNVVDGGSRALLLYNNITKISKEMSATIGYDGRCNVLSHTIEEFDTTDWEHWKPVFEWKMLDHISVNESNIDRDIIDLRCSHKWDFLHANAVDKCPDGNLLVSVRNADTIIKINRQDGSIMWRMGGAISDIESSFKFSRQHHVRCRDSNETHTVLSVFDNASGVDHNPTNPYSRGLFVAVDEVNLKADIIAEYDHPNKRFTPIRGNTERLDNGNVLMGWSYRSLISEHTTDGRLIMTAQILPHWLASYRTYKYQWVGRPMVQPDAVSQIQRTLSNNSTATQVFVSWNGATEVRYWNLYTSDQAGETTLLVASVPRDGFETQVVYEGFASYVIVEALDADGNPLENGWTSVIKTKAPSGWTSSESEKDKWLEDVVPNQEQQTSGVEEEEEEEKEEDEDGESGTSPSHLSMFALGFVVAIGVLIGLWIGSRLTRGKAVWWSSAPLYRPVPRDEEVGGEDEIEFDSVSKRSRRSIGKGGGYYPPEDPGDFRQ